MSDRKSCLFAGFVLFIAAFIVLIICGCLLADYNEMKGWKEYRCRGVEDAEEHLTGFIKRGTIVTKYWEADALGQYNLTYPASGETTLIYPQADKYPALNLVEDDAEIHRWVSATTIALTQINQGRSCFLSDDFSKGITEKRSVLTVVGLWIGIILACVTMLGLLCLTCWFFKR